MNIHQLKPKKSPPNFSSTISPPKIEIDQKVIDIILVIAKSFATKFKFGYYEADDIIQEAFMLGMEGVENFDPERGVKLETFLTHHIYRRLCNFKRNNYFRFEEDGSTDSYKQSKQTLMNKSPDNTTAQMMENYYEADYENKLDSHEIFQLIDNNFPPEHRTLWLRYLGGSLLGIRQSEVLYGVVSSILERHNIDHELHPLSFSYKDE